MMYLLLTWLLSPLAFLRLARAKTPTAQRNILLIQTAKIGDYICSTPIIEALRKSWPTARICLLVAPVTEPLARHQPGIAQVFVLPGGKVRGAAGRYWLYRLLKRERFDTTICLSPNQAFLTMPFLAGVTCRASILPNFAIRSYRLATPFLSAAERHLQGRMTVETGMALLAQLGIDAPLPKKRIVPEPGADAWVEAQFPALKHGCWIGLGISSGNKLKELGKEKLLDLISRLLALAPGIQVALVGAPSDSPLASELLAELSAVSQAANASGNRVLDTTGRIPLERLAALVDRFRLYVGVDSGITYLADARGIPVIDIMGPADPQDQRPTGAQVILLRRDLPCAPCSHAFHAPYTCATGTRACILEIDNHTVTAAIRKELFDETRCF
ncbi:glycosyltransferase family 9 protein [Dentiradicibacter hellwigii]|uniref:Glycosyltransferase family 9 protein n=1 Tax=Dentiradicibacter hellwigii TaxID=3149053 RepID=A0ABV4UH06_9RHOO